MRITAEQAQEALNQLEVWRGSLPKPGAPEIAVRLKQSHDGFARVLQSEQALLSVLLRWFRRGDPELQRRFDSLRALFDSGVGEESPVSKHANATRCLQIGSELRLQVLPVGLKDQVGQHLRHAQNIVTVPLTPRSVPDLMQMTNPDKHLLETALRLQGLGEKLQIVQSTIAEADRTELEVLAGAFDALTENDLSSGVADLEQRIEQFASSRNPELLSTLIQDMHQQVRRELEMFEREYRVLNPESTVYASLKERSDKLEATVNRLDDKDFTLANKQQASRQTKELEQDVSEALCELRRFGIQAYRKELQRFNSFKTDLPEGQMQKLQALEKGISKDDLDRKWLDRLQEIKTSVDNELVTKIPDMARQFRSQCAAMSEQLLGFEQATPLSRVDAQRHEQFKSRLEVLQHSGNSTAELLRALGDKELLTSEIEKFSEKAEQRYQVYLARAQKLIAAKDTVERTLLELQKLNVLENSDEWIAPAEPENQRDLDELERWHSDLARSVGSVSTATRSIVSELLRADGVTYRRLEGLLGRKSVASGLFVIGSDETFQKLPERVTTARFQLTATADQLDDYALVLCDRVSSLHSRLPVYFDGNVPAEVESLILKGSSILELNSDDDLSVQCDELRSWLYSAREAIREVDPGAARAKDLQDSLVDRLSRLRRELPAQWLESAPLVLVGAVIEGVPESTSNWTDVVSGLETATDQVREMEDLMVFHRLSQ